MKKIVRIVRFAPKMYGIEDCRTHSSATETDTTFATYEQALDMIIRNHWTLHTEK